MFDLLKSKLVVLFIIIVLGVTYVHSVNEVKMNEQNNEEVISHINV